MYSTCTKTASFYRNCILKNRIWNNCFALLAVSSFLAQPCCRRKCRSLKFFHLCVCVGEASSNFSQSDESTYCNDYNNNPTASANKECKFLNKITWLHYDSDATLHWYTLFECWDLLTKTCWSQGPIIIDFKMNHWCGKLASLCILTQRNLFQCC